MLELQDFVSSKLDSGKLVGTYSIDLSAAFDLLRPEVLYETIKNLFPTGLTNVIMDFLSHRTFQVEINTQRSMPRKLKVGCVQGSILGPRLFTLYMRNLESILPQNLTCHIVAYADDTYVSIAAETIPELTSNIQQVMTIHDDHLSNIGMKTNVSKTEVIIFNRHRELIEDINVKGTIIQTKPKIKVLGITFDYNLAWKSHIESIKHKARGVMSKLKFLTKHVDRESMKRVVTTHFFGMLYYSSPVWWTEISPSSDMKTLNSLHYKCLRIASKDHHHRHHKLELNKMFNRATPLEWMNYSCAKMAITLMNMQDSGPPMSTRLKHSSYINDRFPGRATMMDSSRLKIGKHSFPNRLLCLKKVKFKWTDGIDNNNLRINLKNTFINQT